MTLFVKHKKAHNTVFSSRNVSAKFPTKKKSLDRKFRPPKRASLIQVNITPNYSHRTQTIDLDVTIEKTIFLLRNLECKEELMCSSVARMNCPSACIPVIP